MFTILVVFSLYWRYVSKNLHLPGMVDVEEMKIVFQTKMNANKYVNAVFNVDLH